MSLKNQVMMPTIQVHCPQNLQNHQEIRDTLLVTQHTNDKTNLSPDSMEPLLALPSDVFNDFEALRSATKLDSPALMRRLLKYYSKLTSSTVDRERKLDNVIEGIRGRSGSAVKEHTSNSNNKNSSSSSSANNNNINSNSAIVLDLSVHKKSQEHDLPTQSLHNRIIDENFELNDPESSPRPLDLTLQKEEPLMILHDNHVPTESSKGQYATGSSLFSTSFNTPVASSCVYSSTNTNQAAPYVINLEPLTSTIQLSTPTQKANEPEQRNGIQLPLAYDSKLLKADGERSFKERPLLHSQPHNSLVSNILTGYHIDKSSAESTTTHVVQNDSKPSSYPPSALFPMPSVPLPSYREAVNSSVFSKYKGSCASNDTLGVKSNGSVRADDIKTNKDLTLKKANIDFSSHLINSDGRQISVLQLKPDFHNVNSAQAFSSSTPENFLLESVNQRHSPPRELSSNPNFLIADSVSTLSTRVKASSAPSSSFRLHAPKENPVFEEHVGFSMFEKSEKNVQRIQLSCESTKPTKSPPNPAIVSGNTIHTLLSTATPSSHNLYSQPAMPLQSLLMSQTSDGTVSNVVAIPVLQGLPEGYTTLQHFTFEPAVPLPAKSETKNASLTTAALPLQPIIVSSPIATTNKNPPPDMCTVANQAMTFDAMPSSENVTQSYSHPIESNKEVVKLKPGRPRGRTGKVSSRKNQNKGMKLLTENSLFPGVYTSILKLPWSKRTRNKSKPKPEVDIKTNHEVHFEDNSIDTVDVEVEDRNLVTETSYIPPEMIVNVKDPMCEQVQERLNGARDEEITEIKRLKITLDQQQHLQQPPSQFQIHLNEEHPKMRNELDVPASLNLSPCVSPAITQRNNGSFTENISYPAMTIKKEFCDPSEICSEIRHNVMLSSASIAAGQEQPNNPNSQDPIMLIYPNIGPNGSKSRKRRGRPPKKPMVEPKVHQDSFLFPVESIFHSSDSISETSFLHGNNPNLTLIPNVSTPLNHEFTLMSPTSLASSLPSLEKTSVNAVKNISSSLEFPNSLKEQDETTLENRIIYLTNQIEMEMARGANQLPKEINNAPTLSKKRPEQNVLPEQNDIGSTTPTNASEDKPPSGIKRRRKKTSRMLKSNENFVYATFRFKPRGGSGAKKMKKKKKANTTSLAANAETLANLRNKKLKCSDSTTHRSDTEAAKNDLGVQSWKFHEQYPSETRSVKSPVPTLSIVLCSSCGVPVKKIHDVPNDLHFCRSCLRSKLGESNDNSADETHVYENGVCHSPPMAQKGRYGSFYNVCITCGKKFEGFSDSDSQCDICQRNTKTFIGSSKLFSIPENTHNESISIPKPFASDQLADSNTLRFSSLDPNTPSTTDGILFCSLCRMQFTKISEYLLHLKETHDATHSSKTSPSSSKSDIIVENTKAYTDSNPRRVKSALKTKKSLAHKTITCPVEDCPLFFRHQRDMDHHLRKVHQSNSLFGSHEVCTSTHQKEVHSAQRQVANLKQVCQSVSSSVENSQSSVFTQPVSSSPVTVNLDDSGDSCGQTQEKPLRCSFCSFRCRQKNAMTWHMRKHPEAASQHRCYSSASSE